MIRSFNGKTPRIAASAFVSEAAYVVGDVDIGEGSSVWPGAVVRGDFGAIRIGSHVCVEDNCVVHSGTPSSPVGDVDIGDRVLLGHGAVLNGRRIGSYVLIGMNATVLHDTEIGDECIIAAGSLVGQGMIVPDSSFVVGIPGRIKGETTEEQLWWVREGTREYEELVRLYRSEGL
jgi:carbonic anhydrase/acetyltransferase-like protein (isoleucine patch superfamily)